MPDALRLMRLGILGGTFDPIHYAHLFIAEEARVRYGLAKILFIPNAVSPFKQADDVEDAAHRYAMVKAAIEANPYFDCSRMEIDRSGPSYTFDTLQALHQERPDAELFFITGMDTVIEIPTWHRAEEVIGLCHFIAAERPGYAEDMAEQGLPASLMAKVLPLPTTHLDISSTEIRRRVQEDLPIRYLTPDPVVDYIVKYGLYR